MLTIGFLMALSALNSNDVVTVYPKRDCLQTYQTRTTKVLNDSVVLFELKDRTVWRNTLKYACPSLAFEERFSDKN